MIWFEGQNKVLEKFGLSLHDPSVQSQIERLESSSMESFRRKLTGLEGKASDHCSNRIFGLFPEKIGILECCLFFIRWQQEDLETEKQLKYQKEIIRIDRQIGR